jgi:hypothetical protein
MNSELKSPFYASDDVVSIVCEFLTVVENCLARLVCRQFEQCALLAMGRITILDDLRFEGYHQRRRLSSKKSIWDEATKHCPNVKVAAYRFPECEVCWCIDALVLWCVDALVLWCVGVLIYWCGVLVFGVLAISVFVCRYHVSMCWWCVSVLVCWCVVQ